MAEHVVDPALGQKLETSIAKLEAIIAPGDTIRCRKGNHGKPVLRKSNASRVTIIADGGAVFSGLNVAAGARNWLIAYAAFRYQNPDPATADIKAITRMVDVAPGAFGITLKRCSFRSVDDVRAWTADDWVRRPANLAALIRGADCIVEECDFSNLRNCLSVSGDGSIARANAFHNFGNDAIQFGASRIQILKNSVRLGRHTALDPLHADAMQGYPKADGTAHVGILIADNIVDMTGAVGDYLQGISAFDGKWQNVEVRTNIVRVNAWHGITFMGVDGIKIIGNTVERAGSGDPKVVPWIEVSAAKDGRPSSGIEVAGNTCARYRLPAGVVAA